MPAPTQPSDIAREVLRLFASRRMPPTPDNFRALYNEVAGVAADDMPFPEKFVRSLARELPRDTAERARLVRLLEQALSVGKPDVARQALTRYLDSLRGEQPPAWNELISSLLRQWESRQLRWTVARKRESLERVLAANDPATLHARLQALVRSWSQAPADPQAATELRAPAPPPAEAAPEQPAPAATPEIRYIAIDDAGEMLAGLRELLLVALETVVPALLGDQPDLTHEAAGFAKAVKAAQDTGALQTVGKQLRKFAYRLEMTSGDRAEVHAGVLNLLRLLLGNIDQLVLDDQWLHGQVETLREIVAKPAHVRTIDDAERRLKEIIFKQSQLKHHQSEAQRSLKTMLAGFIDQLATFAGATGSYHERLGDCAARIAAARDIGEIGGVLDEVLRDTQLMRDEAQRARSELEATRARAQEAEARMATLQRELDETSRLMRHDQLTGALNRRGLEETFDKEAARARRYGKALSVALLDLDNFKAINDTYGHHTGDEALVHLAGVVRQNLRPQDTLARHGGEEFILLYPDTDLEQANVTLVRLQRELTRAFFLAGDKKVLITFSAGVTDWSPEETLDAVLKRADAAMYKAKQTGKNKVVVAAARQ